MLLVARLDGPSAAIAADLVDKAMDAETDGLWGRAYFDLRGTTEWGYKLGDDWIRGRRRSAAAFGFETVVDDSPDTFPARFSDEPDRLYAGWYDHVSGPFARPTVEFMPGAFAYHLHSYSAQSIAERDTQALGRPAAGPGATTTMGCVDEPYLAGTPDMALFFSRWLLGFSFGEAAYACQQIVCWQTTVVGDPLFRPFGQDPRALHEALQRRNSKLIEWSHLRVVNRSLNLVFIRTS